jgi:hypothetical protein
MGFTFTKTSQGYNVLLLLCKKREGHTKGIRSKGGECVFT